MTEYLYRRFANRKSAEKRAARANAIRRHGLQRNASIVVMTEEFYHSIIRGKTVKVRHHITGQLVDEPLGTPHYMSVSSETYWAS